MDAGADVITVAVKNNISTPWAVLLDGASRGANGLVPAEEDVGAWVADCGESNLLFRREALEFDQC